MSALTRNAGSDIGWIMTCHERTRHAKVERVRGFATPDCDTDPAIGDTKGLNQAVFVFMKC